MYVCGVMDEHMFYKLDGYIISCGCAYVFSFVGPTRKGINQSHIARALLPQLQLQLIELAPEEDVSIGPISPSDLYFI